MPSSLITIDFLLGPGPVDEINGCITYQLYIACSDSNMIPEDSQSEDSRIFKEEIERHPDRTNHELFLSSQFPSVVKFDFSENRTTLLSPNKIIEVLYDANANAWKFVRVRNDKLSANNTETIAQLFDLITLPLSIDTIMTCNAATIETSAFDHFSHTASRERETEKESTNRFENFPRTSVASSFCSYYHKFHRVPTVIVVHMLSFLQIPDIRLFSMCSRECWQLAESVRLSKNCRYFDCLKIRSSNMYSNDGRYPKESSSYIEHYISIKTIFTSRELPTYFAPRSMIMQMFGVYNLSEFIQFMRQINHAKRNDNRS